MDHLAHPFDDPFFAGLAAAAGIRRADLPTEYDPSHDWGNDSLTTDLPGMERFSFMCGDDGWYGRIAVYLDAFTYRRLDASTAEIELPIRLSETQTAALAGTPCGRVVDAPVVGVWTVIAAGPHPDDPDETVLTLEVPGTTRFAKAGRRS